MECAAFWGGGCLIVLPPLVERREEIAPFVERFLGRCRVTTGREGPSRIAADVVLRFEAAEWRGNLRDLQGAVERAFLVARAARSEEIVVDHVPEELRTPLLYQHRGDRARNRRLVAWALWKSDGRVCAAAELLHAHRNTIGRIVREVRWRRRLRQGGGAMPMLAFESRTDERSPAVG